MPDVQDIFNNIMSKDPVSFADNLKSVLGQRAVEAINDMRDEISQNLYQSAPQDPDYESNMSATDFDDIDINDFDAQDMETQHDEG